MPNVSTQTDKSWDITTDFLAWFPSEEASAVWADVIKIGDNTSSFGVPDLTFDWEFGFRIGAGYSLEYDQWDTQLYWTWIRAEAHQTQSVSPEFIPIPGGPDLITEFIHPEFFAADLSDILAQTAKIRWALQFNMFDWELGRSYWVSKDLSFRPFLGLKGGWIDQPIELKYENLISPTAVTTHSGIEKAKNNFWGIGPVGGINTKWKLRDFCSHYPSLFGDFSVATLWGTWTYKDVFEDTTGVNVSVNMNRSTLGALMLRGFLGIGWDVDFNKSKSHFTTRLGYEMQLWINQLRLPTSQLIQLHGDLTLQGMTFNCRFDF